MPESTLENKDVSGRLFRHLNGKMISEIKQGVWQPKERLPGQRVLAERYGVSRTTVIEALKSLEMAGYIESIPSKGVYVLEHASEEVRRLKVVLPFPERSMSLVTLSWEQWGIVSETFHGLNEVADANGASVLFRHLSEAEDRLLAKGRAPDWVDDVDAAVFMSEQLSTLRTVLSARGIPCVVLEHESSDRSSGLSTVNYDRSQALTEIARFLHERGYREVGILGDTTALCQLKKRLFIASALEFGLRVKTEACFDLDCDTAQAARDAVAGAFPDRESLPEVFFLANSTLAPSALLQTAWDRHWRIGEDFGVIGMASKVAFSNTIPSITYYQVPRCEMGRVACNLAIDLAQEATPSHAVARHAVVQGRIIPGASTR